MRIEGWQPTLKKIPSSTVLFKNIRRDLVVFGPRLLTENEAVSIPAPKSLKRNKAMSLQAFFVLGPESTGNRVLTAALANAGCLGQRDWKVHEQPLDDPCKCSFGQYENDCVMRKAFTEGQSVVWRRSMPHGRQWPDLDSMLRRIRCHNFDDVKIVMPIRNNFCTVRAQIKEGHLNDVDVANLDERGGFAKRLEKAQQNITLAIAKIGDFATRNGLAICPIPLESLIDPRVLEHMCCEWGLVYESTDPPVEPPNAKYLANAQKIWGPGQS